MKAFSRGTSVSILVVAAASLARAADDPALVRAVRAGDATAVAALLKQKADVNAAAIDGTTALHWAVRADDIETVDALIRAGAQRQGREPTRRDAALSRRRQRQRRDDPPAARGGRGCRMAPTSRGETALMAAVRAGKPDAVRALLEPARRSTPPNRKSDTPH